MRKDSYFFIVIVVVEVASAVNGFVNGFVNVVRTFGQIDYPPPPCSSWAVSSSSSMKSSNILNVCGGGLNSDGFSDIVTAVVVG